MIAFFCFLRNLTKVGNGIPFTIGFYWEEEMFAGFITITPSHTARLEDSLWETPLPSFSRSRAAIFVLMACLHQRTSAKPGVVLFCEFTRLIYDSDGSITAVPKRYSILRLARKECAMDFVN